VELGERQVSNKNLGVDQRFLPVDQIDLKIRWRKGILPHAGLI